MGRERSDLYLQSDKGRSSGVFVERSQEEGFCFSEIRRRLEAAM